MKRLFKVLFVLTLGFILFNTTSFNTIDAKSKEIEQYTLFEEEVTLRNKRTKVDVGFVTVIFPKEFVDNNEYPLTFEIRVYAEEGSLFVEFEPDYEDFAKDVIIRVHRYEGYIFDIAEEEFIYVEVERDVFLVPHFSRWCFVR